MGKAEDSQASKPLISSTDRTKESRSCNDILFAILFALCCAGMIAVSSVAFKQGNPSLLTQKYTNPEVEGYAQGWFEKAVSQVSTDKDIIIGSIAVAVVLGFVWIQLMRMFTKLFIYLSLFAGVAAVIGLGGYFVRMGLQQDDGFKIVGFVLFGLAAILLVMVILLRKKIALTSAMFAETCRGVQNNLALFPVSMIVIAMFLGFAAYWTASFVYLYSIPEDTVTVGDSTVTEFNPRVRNLMFFMVFGFFWMSAFLSAVFQHAVAGAIGTWYFSRSMLNGRNASGAPAVSSLFRALTTSFGSLAFGALLIAFVEFLNFLLQYAKKSNPQNKFLKFIASCVQCILGCVEGIIRYVNKFAYIYVAMHGYGFCKSAKECFDLISRNFFTTVIMDVISGFVLFMGKILFTAVSVMITMGYIEHSDRDLSAVTVSLTAVISFVVLHIISHIVGVGINTVFVCYLEDLEQNKGTNMYVSPEIHAMLQDKVQENKSKTSNV